MYPGMLLPLVCVVLCCVTPSQQQTQGFQLDPADYSSNTGGFAFFQLIVAAGVTGDGTWYRNNVALSQDSIKIFITTSGDVRQIVIQSIVAADAGTYTFRVNNFEVSAVLTVDGNTGVTPAIQTGLQSFNVAPGTTVTFETTLSQANVNSGTWRRNGAGLTSSAKYQITVVGQTQRLVITNVQSSDAGQYTYQVGSLTTTGTLTVQTALSILNGLQSFNVAPGTTVTFETTLSQANVNSGTWRRNGAGLTSSAKYQITVVGQTQRLVITNVQSSDVGQYTYQVGSLTTTGTLTVQTALSILNGLQSFNVAPGTTVTFETSLSQANVNSGTWRRNGAVLTSSAKYQITVVGQTQRLVITNAQSSDVGQYTYQVGSLTTTGTLTVQTALSILNGLQSFNVAPGTTVTFETSLSQANVNSGTWRRNGAVLTSSAKYQITVVGQTQRLVITNAQSSDVGQYTYQVGSLTTTGTLTVQTALSILNGLQSFNVAPGTTVTFETSLSQANVNSGTWRRNGAVLTSSAKYQITVVGQTQRLVITNAQSSDVGQYTYQVGSLTTTGTLTVQTALSILNGLQSFNVAPGTTVTFETSLSQANVNSGTWRRNGAVLTSSAKYQITVVGQTQRLVITNAQSSDVGQYTYQVGSLTTTGTLTVQTALSILNGLQSFNVAPGTTVTFETSLSQANVNSGTWRRNGAVLTSSAKYQITVVGQTQRLVITNAQSSDVGQYTYQVGSLTTTGTLTVQTALSILNGLQSFNVATGTTVTFDTSLSQANVNSGTWRRNGVVLTSSAKYQITVVGQTQRLVITNAQSSDVGQYTYQVGSLTTTGTLTVQTAPVNGGYSEWTQWNGSPCSVTCGTGPSVPRTRTRECNNPVPINGGQQCTGENSEIQFQPCTFALCVDPANHLCRNAQNRNGIGYRRHPMDCDKYVQCYYNPNGNIIGVYRTCPTGYYWDQTNLKCDENWKVTCPLERCTGKCKPHYKMDGGCRSYWECSRGSSVAKCCNQGFMYVQDEGCRPNFFCRDTCPSSCGDSDVCAKVPNWDNDIATYNVTVGFLGVMATSCRFSSYFDVSDCGCSFLDSGCSPQYDLTFNDQGVLNFARAAYLSYSNVTVANGIATFNDNSMFFANISISNINTTHQNVVRFRYRESSSSGDRRVLVSGSNCGNKNSLVIAIDNEYLTFEVMSRYGNTVKLPISTAGMSRYSWKRVTMIYSGYDIVASIESENIKYTARVYASDSNIIECGLRFGYDGSGTSGAKFVGELDEIAVYSCNPGNIL
ncbi:obscurin-like isoform X1 [Haliotis rufescens]|uniref:obscurin-like isoform X1 n=1 Tax=Haliotis rufescens TaxID=6454 RepID=UPI00201ED914|nr:obscurin-like isoform X1 [Haliotis rufescens]